MSDCVKTVHMLNRDACQHVMGVPCKLRLHRYGFFLICWFSEYFLINYHSGIGRQNGSWLELSQLHYFPGHGYFFLCDTADIVIWKFTWQHNLGYIWAARWCIA